MTRHLPARSFLAAAAAVAACAVLAPVPAVAAPPCNCRDIRTTYYSGPDFTTVVGVRYQPGVCGDPSGITTAYYKTSQVYCPYTAR